MEIQSVFSPAFAPYGQVLEGLDTAEFLQTLQKTTVKPTDCVVYVPSHAPLEALPSARYFSESLYGGLPLQIGYCNGSNTRLNCLEYHKSSEINITADEMVLLVARQQDLQNRTLDTATVQAFRVSAGTAVELYATTLHYAPCDGAANAGFRVAIILPQGTNTEKPAVPLLRTEDYLLRARNKWLIAHADAPEAAQGAFIGLQGENIDIIHDLTGGM